MKQPQSWKLSAGGAGRAKKEKVLGPEGLSGVTVPLYQPYANFIQNCFNVREKMLVVLKLYSQMSVTHNS